MALSKEVIIQNESLKGLSEEQITTIETLSKNDENVVIGNRIGELHGDYEKDVLLVTGIPKNQGEKGYDYVKRTLGHFKTEAQKATELSTKIETLNSEIENYKIQIAAGKGSEVMAQQLKDAQAKAAQLQTQYETDKQNWEKEKQEYMTEKEQIRFDHVFDKAVTGLKFKKEYDEEIQQTLVDSAKAKILAQFKPDWIENTKGGKTLVFRDAAGNIQNNPENKMEPFTISELLTNQLKKVIDFGKKQEGAGTDNSMKNDMVSLVDVSSAKTQVEADEIIEKYLLQQGMIKGTSAFATEQRRIRTENKVETLKMR